MNDNLQTAFSEQPVDLSTPLPPPPQPHVGKAIVVIVLLAWLAYANSLTKTFVLDDHRWILENEFLGDWRTNLQHHWSRPVVALSLTANYLIGGTHPANYHLLNGLIHVVAALALFGIVRRTLLLPRWHGRFDAASLPLAFATAAIWAVHPLNTHAVTYVIQRCESGMGMCYALALYSMIRGSQATRSWPWYFASIAAAWVGIGCKEVMVTILAVGLLYDRIFLADSWLEIVRRRWYLYLGWSSIFLLPLRAHLHNLILPTHDEAAKAGFVTVGFNIHRLSFQTYLQTEANVILHYLWLAVWPFNLCFDYSDWPLAESWRDAAVSGSAILAVLLVCFYGAVRRNGFAFLGLAFFLVLSTSTFVPIVHVANEYRTYVSLMALVTGFVVGGYLVLSKCWSAFARSSLVQAAVLAPIVVGLLVLTYKRNEDYRNQVALWTDVAEKRPQNYKAYCDIATAQMNVFNLDEARVNLEKCLAGEPRYYFGLLNLGILHNHQDRVPEGLELLRQAWDVYPTNRKLTNGYYGLFLHLDGQDEKAMEIFDEMKKVAPESATARFYRAGVLLELPGRGDEARKEIAEGVKDFPDWASTPYTNAADRLRGFHGDSKTVRKETLFYARLADAIAAAAGDPDPEYKATLADAYAWNGRYDDTIASIRMAIASAKSKTQTREFEQKLKGYEAKVKAN